MKDNLIIHIGLGKAASSSLQAKIFPLISKNLGYYHISNKSPINNQIDLNLKNLMTKHVTNMILGFDVNKITFPKYSIVSNEGLSSYRQPQFYEEFAEKNLQTFGYDAHILLVIRKPSDFLNSIYVQCCVHEKPLQDPEYFFLNNENFSLRYPDNSFYVDCFKYTKLIDHYKKRFKKLTVIKYEKLKDAENLQKIFKFDDKLKNEITMILNKLKVNRSLGKKGLNYLRFVNKIFGLVGLNYKSKYNNKILISRLNDSNKNEMIKLNKFKYNVFSKISKIFMNPAFIDKIFGYEKISLNFEELNIDIKKLDEEYNHIKDYQHFQN